jgi:hypothetical protein
MLAPLWTLLHPCFAFSFVGSLVVAEWNARVARTSTSGSQSLLWLPAVIDMVVPWRS